MINVQKFLDEVTADLQSRKTQSDMQANAQKALDVLRAGVDAALENANSNDEVEIRRLLGDAQTGLKRIDVERAGAKAVRRDLSSQIKAILLSLSR